MSAQFTHLDPLISLDSAAPLGEKLRVLHGLLREHLAFIDRLAVALYDARSDLIKTYACSSAAPSPLTQYEATLASAPSLQEIVRKRSPRIVNDMAIYAANESQHARVLRDSGFQSSYTMPMFHGDALLGFIFFNSFQANVFSDRSLGTIDMVGHMISLIVANEQDVLGTLQATVKAAMHFTHHRDPETATHIDRMSRYARLIAQELAEHYGFDDQFVEHIFLFSPLHDLGKIAIPDNILLKPGKLSEQEFNVMKTHTEKGRELVDTLLKSYGLEGISYVDMLRNIAFHHHEAVNGSGYPVGLKAQEIPIEARIVAVADVFDALTSRRSYKPAWDNDKAFDTMRALAGVTLDADCVQALLKHAAAIKLIQQQFSENMVG